MAQRRIVVNISTGEFTKSEASTWKAESMMGRYSQRRRTEKVRPMMDWKELVLKKYPGDKFVGRHGLEG